MKPHIPLLSVSLGFVVFFARDFFNLKPPVGFSFLESFFGTILAAVVESAKLISELEATEAMIHVECLFLTYRLREPFDSPLRLTSVEAMFVSIMCRTQL